MKYFKLTYYLLFICIAAVSCTTDTDDIINPDQAKEEMRVQLTIWFPETATRATTDPGTAEERNIDNVHLYAFEADANGIYRLKEEAKVAAISNEQSNKSRTIQGVLFQKYTKNIKLVALANLNNKGLNFAGLPGIGTDISTFYKKMVFTRTDASQWPLTQDNKLPMWGECEMDQPKPGNNTASLNLTRAVAKVNVLVNGGQGIKGKEFFKISQIEICQYNDRGFCTTGDDLNSPNVPAEATRAITPLVYRESTPSYVCENRIYISEQKNVGVADNQKVFLNLTAIINDKGDTEKFKIDFKKDGIGNDFNVLRNNMYRFNILSVKTEEEKVVEITFDYVVVDWDPITIDVPSFN